MPFKHDQTHVGLFSLNQLSQPWLSRSWQSLRCCLELPCNKMPLSTHCSMTPAPWRLSVSRVPNTQLNEVMLSYK